MKISEIKNKTVKIGKTSITVFGDNGKTCGVVRNIEKFKDLQPNKQIDYIKRIRESGLWGNGVVTLDSVIVANGELFYLNDLRAIKGYELYFANIPKEDISDTTKKVYNIRLSLAENAKKYMTVIDCYLA